MTTILVVEDNLANLEIMSRLLELSSYTVVTAMNGYQAIEVAERYQPDLILMDLAMPEMDGWETTRRLKQKQSLADIPVIAVSAHATIEDRQRALEAGCVDFLLKPVLYEDLLFTIQEQLAWWRARSPNDTAILP